MGKHDKNGVGGKLSRDLEIEIIDKLKEPDTEYTADWFYNNSFKESAGLLSKAFKDILAKYGKKGMTGRNVQAICKRLKYRTSRQDAVAAGRKRRAEEAAADSKQPQLPLEPPAPIGHVPPEVLLNMKQTYESIMALLQTQQQQLAQVEAKLDELLGRRMPLPLPAPKAASAEPQALAYQAK